MNDERDSCRHCGQTEGHQWIEGDCVLPHRAHSRALINGTNVCEPCIERWDEWLTEIVDLYSTLGSVIPLGSLPDDTAHHGHQKHLKQSPAPFRIEPWAIVHGRINDHRTDDYDGHTIRSAYLDANIPHFADVLAGWCDYTNEHHGITTTAPETLTGAAAYLRANTRHVAALPAVDDYDLELRWLRRTLRSAHGITDPEPLCDCLTIDCNGHVWRMTAGNPACDHCGRRYDTLDLVRARGDGLRTPTRLTARSEGNGGRG